MCETHCQAGWACKACRRSRADKTYSPRRVAAVGTAVLARSSAISASGRVGRPSASPSTAKSAGAMSRGSTVSPSPARSAACCPASEGRSGRRRGADGRLRHAQDPRADLRRRHAKRARQAASPLVHLKLRGRRGRSGRQARSGRLPRDSADRIPDNPATLIAAMTSSHRSEPCLIKRG